MAKPYDKDYKPREEGLFDIPDEIYFRIDALNMSSAKLFDRSAAHVRASIDEPNSGATYAMRQGTGFHWRALQPEKFRDDVIMELSANKNSKVYKAWLEEQPEDKLILTGKDIVNIRRMVAEMHKRESVMAYLASGWAERAMLWFEPKYGIWCKGKLDFIRSDGEALVDLKKTQVATRWAFEGAIKRYGYYYQAFHYMRGYEHLTGTRAKEWIWIAAEIDPPHGCRVFRADNSEIDAAGAAVESYYKQYAECQTNDSFFILDKTKLVLGVYFDNSAIDEPF